MIEGNHSRGKEREKVLVVHSAWDTLQIGTYYVRTQRMIGTYYVRTQRMIGTYYVRTQSSEVINIKFIFFFISQYKQL